MLLLRPRQVTIDIVPGSRAKNELNYETSDRAGVLIIALLSAVSFKRCNDSLNNLIEWF